MAESANNIVTIVAVATAIGSAIGFVISSLIKVIESKAERKQKRIELHVQYLQDQIIRIDERLDTIINSNAVSVGTALAQEYFDPEDKESALEHRTIFNFAITQNRHELKYLEGLCSTYGIIDNTFNFEITEIQIRINQLHGNVSKGVKAVHLTEALHILMDIQVKYRTILSVLVEKLLK